MTAQEERILSTAPLLSRESSVRAAPSFTGAEHLFEGCCIRFRLVAVSEQAGVSVLVRWGLCDQEALPNLLTCTTATPGRAATSLVRCGRSDVTITMDAT
jgi:hypothetical protein